MEHQKLSHFYNLVSFFQCLKQLGYTSAKIQLGKSEVVPNSSVPGLDIIHYKYKDSLQNDISEADLVISHAGKLHVFLMLLFLHFAIPEKPV